MRRLLVRAGNALLLLWLVTTLTFLLLHLAPGDPAAMMVSPTATADEIAAFRARFGLDAPLPVQYVLWLGNVLRGDLGTSITHARPVAALIRDALPVSLFLGGTSLVLSYVLGILLGVVQSRRAGSRSDTALTVLSTTVYAAPSFWLALAVVVVATTGASALGAPSWLRLPAFGMRDPAALATGFDALRDAFRHALLPVLVLAVPGAAGVARYARQALLEARSVPHVDAARARGVPVRSIEWRYILRNALPPLIVLFGLMLPGIVAGSVFVEQIFAWPGLGRAMLSAIAGRDYPVVLGMTLMYAATVIGANLLAELAVLRVDPRRRI